MRGPVLLCSTLLLLLLLLPGAQACPGGQRCGGCCPPDQGVSGEKRCCPEGHSCGADGHSCVPTGVVACSDIAVCPDNFTCCKNPEGIWMCCPLPQAVCCSDGNHCCPANYTCSRDKCVHGDQAIPWYTKLPANPSIAGVPAQPASVQCDNKLQCPEHTTCCQMDSGRWGCCQLQNAVCCPDKLHCCPHGYTCNPTSTSCHKRPGVALTPKDVLGSRLTDVKCDEQTSCQDGQTCCRMSATSWGCCPLPNAVCCSDMINCCPNGFTCTEGGGCTMKLRPDWSTWRRQRATRL